MLVKMTSWTCQGNSTKIIMRQYKCFKENGTWMLHSMFVTYKWIEMGITPC